MATDVEKDGIGEFLHEFGAGEGFPMAKAVELGHEGIAMLLENRMGTAKGGHETAINHVDEDDVVIGGECAEEGFAVAARGGEKAHQAVAVERVFHGRQGGFDNALLVLDEEVLNVGFELFDEGVKGEVVVDEVALAQERMAAQDPAQTEAEKKSGDGVALCGQGVFETTVVEGLEKIGQSAKIKAVTPEGEIEADQIAGLVGGDQKNDQQKTAGHRGDKESAEHKIHDGKLRVRLVSGGIKARAVFTCR